MTDLVKETMESYNEYIGNLPRGCQTIADLFREDRVVEASRLILEFSNGMQWIIQVNRLLNENGISIEMNPEKINEFLVEVNNGLEIQDYVLIADMFEYEIKPFFEECNLYYISDNQ